MKTIHTDTMKKNICNLKLSPFLKWTVFLFFIFIVQISAFSAEELSFKHLTVNQGLGSNQIHSIYKDKNGFMWFGTNYGLARYDGNRIRNFSASFNDPMSLQGNQVYSVGKWIDGRLLLSTNRGLSLYNPITETYENHFLSMLQQWGVKEVPQRILVDEKGIIWIATRYHCYTYHPKEKRLKEKLSLKAGEDLSDMALSGKGVLLVTNKGALYCLTTKGVCWRTKGFKTLDAADFFSLFPDKQGNVWVYSMNEIWVYSLVKGLPTLHKAYDWLASRGVSCPEINTLLPRTMAQDGEGRIWIGTDHSGILLLDLKNRSAQIIKHDALQTYSLVGNSAKALYADEQGAMWIGSYKNGISYYNPSRLRFSTLLRGDVTSVCRLPSGEIFAGTDVGELLRFSADKKTFTKVVSLSEKVAIVSLLASRNGTLWIGTFQGGLYEYSAGKIKHYGAAEGLSCNHVWALAEDRKGRLWIATLGGGVQCYEAKNKRFQTFEVARYKQLGSNYVSSLAFLADGSLLGASSEGIFHIDPEQKKITALKGAQLSRVFTEGINQVYIDRRQLLWIASSSGLWVRDPKKGRCLFIGRKQGLPHELIHAIAEDAEGTMWVSTARGLTNLVLKPSSNNSDTQGLGYSFQLFNYDKGDGLDVGEPNSRSLLAAPNGQIFLGGVEGLASFVPSGLRRLQMPPKPVFTTLFLNGEEAVVGKLYAHRQVLPKALNAMGELELSSSQNVFSIAFAPLNYNLPDQLGFRYQLDGLNKEWMVGDANNHKVTFTSLPPGKYLLRVRYVTYGERENVIAELPIVIHPPFYLTWWAFAVYFLLLGLFVNMAYQWFRRKQDLKKMEEERKRENELNELKQRFFTSVSHDLRTPLTLILSPLETLLAEVSTQNPLYSRLSLIQRNAQRLLQLVSQLLDFRKSEMKANQLHLSYTDLADLLKEIGQLFADYAVEQSIDFKIELPATPCLLKFDRDKIGKVVTNLLSNAFKFTPSLGCVSLSLKEDQVSGDVLFSVVDNGVGIPKEERERIFERFYQINRLEQPSEIGSGVGLSIVKDFVELHGGTIQVSEGYTHGSCFTVRLPASLRYSENRSRPVLEEGFEEQAPRKASRERRVILVVDDNTDLLCFLKESLSEEYEIWTATNGKIAWEMIQQHLPDLILSDVMMPEMDGNDFCRLAKNHIHSSRVPFILLTAKQDEESHLEGLASGADEYLTKPFSVALLKLRISKLLEWSSWQPQLRVEKSTTLAGGSQEPLYSIPEPLSVEITSVDEKFIQEAVKYVEAKMNNPELSVEELSKHLCMSRAHLYKRMIALMGCKPIVFIRTIRLKRARLLLCHSRQSVAEVAYEVGFNNPKYFSQYFKEEYGMLPSEFKKRWADEAVAPLMDDLKQMVP